jgi:hypothetical protein
VQSLLAACNGGGIEAVVPFSKDGVANALFAADDLLDVAEKAYWHELDRAKAQLEAAKKNGGAQ